MQKNPLFHLSWYQYLTLLLLMFAMGFFASGVITWLAANWDDFSKLQKLYGTQTLFLITFVFAGFFYYRESRKSDSRWLTSSFFFLLAVLIGALFALIGQTYQTGANAWQLFAFWSLCQLPFVLLFPNVATALLLMATCNITFILLQDSFSHEMHYGLVGLNFVFLLLSEWAGKYWRDVTWRILPKCSTLLLVFSFFLLLFHNQSVALTWLLVAGLIFYYKARRFDFLILVMLFLYAIVSLNVKFFIDIAEDLVAVTLTAFLSNLVGIGILRKWFKQRYPEQEKITWHIYPLVLVLIEFCSLLLLATLFFTFKFDEAQDLAYVAVVFFIIAIFLHNAQIKHKKGELWGTTLDSFVSIGATLYFISFLFTEYESLRFFTMLAIFAFFYWIRPAPWLRFSLGGACLVGLLLFIGYFDNRATDSLLAPLIVSLPDSFILIGIILYYYIAQHEENPRSDFWLPMVWAMMLVGLNLFTIHDLVWLTHTEMAPALPDVSSISDWFHLITSDFFRHTTTNALLVKLLRLMVAFSPLILFWRIERSVSTKNRLVIMVGFVILGIALVATNTMLAYFALLLLAYLSRSRILFAVAVLGVMFSLSLYYYLLLIPLLHKSFLLIGSGMVFAIMASASFYRTNGENAATLTQQTPFTPLAWQPLSKFKLVIATVVVLGIGFLANQKIMQYEDVLRNGDPVVLKIAPLDPRSLMQGDYMHLNYAILDEINGLDEEKTGTAHRIYALLKRNEGGEMGLCRLTEQVPSDFSGCVDKLYLPVNMAYLSPRLPSQDYFFAEGKGEYYAQAEYAEYRFKDGVILLHRLLDKDFNAL
ncbi:GDYXXLXY domain-containing protein [Pasteurella sp. PK-2025]|uniref:GDYXXLXY domain-containing protein n=1 Tax=Pasteurella sp. PK-2025 TaxID=3413133 RepID=UPI003C71582E